MRFLRITTHMSKNNHCKNTGFDCKTPHKQIDHLSYNNVLKEF